LSLVVLGLLNRAWSGETRVPKSFTDGGPSAFLAAVPDVGGGLPLAVFLLSDGDVVAGALAFPVLPGLVPLHLVGADFVGHVAGISNLDLFRFPL
jgi:hypothetical protein